MLHIRYTGTNPMSDYGHAMFADMDQEESVRMYGKCAYTFESEQEGVEYIEALNDKIIEARRASELEFNDHLTDDEFCASFSPPAIVDGADAWDNGEMLTWFCEWIAIPLDLKGITTQDGAIVFDVALINRATEYEGKI